MKPTENSEWTLDTPASILIEKASLVLTEESPARGLGSSAAIYTLTCESCGYIKRIPKAVARLLDLASPERITLVDLELEINEKQKAAATIKLQRLLEGRDRTVKEMADRLRNDLYDESVIESVILQAKEYGYLDDSRYARYFVEGKLRAGWGRPKILRELTHRGVDFDALENDAFDLSAADDELQRALSELHRRSTPKKNPRETLFRRLISKGYSSDVATSATRRYLEEIDEDNSENSLN